MESIVVTIILAVLIVILLVYKTTTISKKNNLKRCFDQIEETLKTLNKGTSIHIHHLTNISDKLFISIKNKNADETYNLIDDLIQGFWHANVFFLPDDREYSLLEQLYQLKKELKTIAHPIKYPNYKKLLI